MHVKVTHMVRITQKNVLSGIRFAEIQGKHRAELRVNVVGSNIKAPDLSKKHIKLDADQDIEVKGSSQIDDKLTAENEFMASNSDMRGKKSSTVYRGNRVYEWNPARDFRPDAVGDTQRGGAFKGGFINEANQKARKGYAPPQGHIRKGVGHAGEGIRNVNPFSINLRVKARDL